MNKSGVRPDFPSDRPARRRGLLSACLSAGFATAWCATAVTFTAVVLADRLPSRAAWAAPRPRVRPCKCKTVSTAVSSPHAPNTLSPARPRARTSARSHFKGPDPRIVNSLRPQSGEDFAKLPAPLCCVRGSKGYIRRSALAFPAPELLRRPGRSSIRLLPCACARGFGIAPLIGGAVR